MTSPRFVHVCDSSCSRLDHSELMLSIVLKLALKIGCRLQVEEICIIGPNDFVATPKVRVTDREIGSWCHLVLQQEVQLVAKIC